MKQNKRLFLSVLAAFALLVAACGSDDGDGGEAASGDLPGAGIDVTMARADWSTGYFQAELYKLLMEELGYTVSEPSELELGPSLAYLAMADGDFDFWVNSWYPGHAGWLEAEMTDGSLVGDHVSILGEEMLAGGLQGYLIDKATADEFGITHLDQLNDDPEITALFDSNGDGVAEILGCQESWTCDNIIESQIAFSGWENVEQSIAGYDANVAEAIARVEEGEPMVIYTWTPSAYVTQLIPGENVYWLAVEEVIDDSNPLGEEGGTEWDQTPGQAAIPAEQCPAAADADTCQLGWIAADIQVTANNEFIEANPAAAELFRQVKLSVLEVSQANVEQDAGCDTVECIRGLAETWIEENRDTVDTWMEAALAAA